MTSLTDLYAAAGRAGLLTPATVGGISLAFTGLAYLATALVSRKP